MTLDRAMVKHLARRDALETSVFGPLEGLAFGVLCSALHDLYSEDLALRAEARAWIAGGAAHLTFDACCAALSLDARSVALAALGV